MYYVFKFFSLQHPCHWYYYFHLINEKRKMRVVARWAERGLLGNQAAKPQAPIPLLFKEGHCQTGLAFHALRACPAQDACAPSPAPELEKGVQSALRLCFSVTFNDFKVTLSCTLCRWARFCHACSWDHFVELFLFAQIVQKWNGSLNFEKLPSLITAIKSKPPVNGEAQWKI